MKNFFCALLSVVLVVMAPAAFGDCAGAQAACNSANEPYGACGFSSAYQLYETVTYAPGGYQMFYCSTNYNTTATPEQKATANASAQGDALAAGLGAAAQTAAGQAAEDTLDAYMAAGKSFADASAAASVAGRIAGEENAMASISGVYSSEIALFNSCMAGAGGSYSSCQSTLGGAHAAAAAAGITQTPVYRTAADGSGNYTAYMLMESGSWFSAQFDSTDTIISGSAGSVPSLLPFSPTGTGGAGGGGGVMGAGGGGGGAGAPAKGSAAAVPSGGGGIAVVDKLPTPSVTYTEGASVVCVASQAADGTWSLVGAGCGGGKNPGATATGANVGIGSGAGSGSALSDSLLTTIKNWLDPTSVTQAQKDLTAQKTALDAAEVARAASFGTATQKTELGLGLSITWPTAGCSNPSFAIPGGRGSLVVPMCEKRSDIQAILNWFVSIVTAFVLFGIGINALIRKG